MEKQKVIIVGAGPAGASCAKALQAAGIQALIIEKEELPRHKTCSGVLFGQTQVLLQQIFGSLPPEQVYCQPREIPASHILAGDPNRTLHCDYLVGADGSASAVRRALTPDWWQASPDVVIYQVYSLLADRGRLREGCWHVFFEKSIGDILCCAHQKDSCLVLCVGAFKGRDVRAGMEAFKLFLRKEFQVVLGPEERVEGCIMKPSPLTLGSGRVLLTGEAAGFMYLNGEGISAALDSGYRCVPAIASAIQEGGDALEKYRAATADMVSHMEACTQQGHFLVP